MEGSKYESHRTLAEVVACIREDIKAATTRSPSESGSLPPGIEVDVRIVEPRSARTCCRACNCVGAITAHITAFPVDFLNPAYMLMEEAYEPATHNRFCAVTWDGVRALAVLEHIIDEYNFRREDFTTGDVEQRFHSVVLIAPTLEEQFRAELLVRIQPLLADVRVALAAGETDLARQHIEAENTGHFVNRDHDTALEELTDILAAQAREEATARATAAELS